MRYRDNKLRNYKITKLQNSSCGYILLTLMLFLALLAIAAAAVLPEIAFQIRRDREEEMIHRAVGYQRAIRKYYKKFGRYPARVEELENTNQLRFLRKRYKDPITGKDFKLLHLGDPALALLGVGQGVGQGLGQGLGQGQGQGANQGFVGATGGGIRPAGPGDANAPQVTGLPQQQNTGTPNAAGGTSDNPDTQVDAKTSGSAASDSSGPGQRVFGGGPILGVASISKAKTIREFCNKSHYNDWPFLYNPAGDRGGLLNTPYCSSLNQGGGFGQPAAGPGVAPSPGQGGKPQPAPGPGPAPGPEPPEE